MIIADQVKKEEEKQMFELKTQENEVQGIYLHTNLKFFYLNKVHLILFYFTPKWYILFFFQTPGGHWRIQEFIKLTVCVQSKRHDFIITLLQKVRQMF